VALRRIRSPDDLSTIVEALTVVIPESHPQNQEERGPPAIADNPRPVEPSRNAPPAPMRTPAAGQEIRVELGIGAEGRMSGAPTYLSAGGTGYAGLRPGAWLFAIIARWQPSEVPAKGAVAGFEMESAGAGFLVARRFLRTHALGVDAGATVLMLVDTQSVETRTPDEVGSAADARFGLLVRALLGAGAWRFAPSIDADLAPARIRRSIRIDPDLPPLPKWSIGLGLGVSWTEP
jgi:hypothetical protein